MRALAAAACAAALLLTGCGGDAGEPDAGTTPTTTPSASATPSSPAPTPTASLTPTTLPPAPAAPPKRRQRAVLAISVDGLNVRALSDTGAFARLRTEGVSTLNARTAVEQTVTLPNHTSMVTGRRIDPDQGGHGVTWNDELAGRTVPGPDGDGVASVFDVVHESGGSTALFAGKPKFATLERSWPDAIDELEIDGDADALVDEVVDDLTEERRRFTFLHLEVPDEAGHASGWLSPAYVAAVAHTDQLLGELLDTIDGTPRLSRRLVVVVTSDHGGPFGEERHDDAGDIDNYRIPFYVWGRGIAPGDLYELNRDYADPGRAQPSYDGTQPVRNGDLANLALDVLGLGPVPGSELNAGQERDWR